jgi:hypothetical protein
MDSFQKDSDNNLPDHWLRVAHVAYPEAEWIRGDGRWGSICDHGPGRESLQTIELYSTKQLAQEAADGHYCCELPAANDTITEPVMIWGRDLKSMSFPEQKRLRDQVVDLKALVSQRPQLEEEAKSVTLPDPDEEHRQILTFLAVQKRRWDLEKQARLMPLVDSTNLASAEYKPPEFLVEYIVPRQGLTLFTGDVGSTKTAFAMQLAVAISTNKPVAGLFATSADPTRPIIYMNGEMGGDEIQRYLKEAIAGLGAAPPSQALLFTGKDGVASFGFGRTPDWRSEAFEAVLKLNCPRLVIIDSLRALSEIDETNLAEVRAFFNWLRYLAIKYNCAFIVLHHLRKLGLINSTRERVSGSRDLLASCDVHIAAISSNGAPMHTLELGKTRSPWNGVSQGTKWQIEAKLEFGPNPNLPPKSIFIAKPSLASWPTVSAIDKAKAELRSRLATGVPMTRQQLGAKDGSLKRAFDAMLGVGEIVECGKLGRRTLYTLAGTGKAIDGQPGHESGHDVAD